MDKWSHKNKYYFHGNPECKTLPANSIGIFKYLWAEIRIRKKGDKASQNWKMTILYIDKYTIDHHEVFMKARFSWAA